MNNKQRFELDAQGIIDNVTKAVEHLEDLFTEYTDDIRLLAQDKASIEWILEQSEIFLEEVAKKRGIKVGCPLMQRYTSSLAKLNDTAERLIQGKVWEVVEERCDQQEDNDGEEWKNC